MMRNEEKIIGFLDGCMTVRCNPNTAYGIGFRVDSLKSVNRTICNENFIEEYVDNMINVYFNGWDSDNDYLESLCEEYKTDAFHLRNKLIKTFLNNPKEFFEFWNRDEAFYADMVFEDEVITIGDEEYFYKPEQVFVTNTNQKESIDLISKLSYIVDENLLENIKKIIPYATNEKVTEHKDFYFNLRDKINNQLKEIDNNKILSSYLQKNKDAVELSRL